VQETRGVSDEMMSYISNACAARMQGDCATAEAMPTALPPVAFLRSL
jgi:hypothetical protein